MRKTSLRGFNGLLVALLALCAFAGGVVLDKVVLKGKTLWPPLATPPAHDEIRVLYHTLYEKCGDVVTETHSVSRDGIGEYLAMVPTEWQVLSQASSGASSGHEFSRSIDDFCPEHARFRFVTITGGLVAVYRGKSSGQPRLLVREYRDLPESHLRQAEREQFRRGIVLEDEPGLVDAKVAKYLEGLID